MSPVKLKMDKAKKEKAMLMVLFALIVVVVYFQFLIRPATNELKEILPKVSKLKRDISGAKGLIANKPIMLKRQKDLTAALNKYEQVLPREREIPKLLDNLSGIAAKSGVKIVGIKPISAKSHSADASENIYQKIPIEVIAHSGYHQLGEFINKLETGDRFIMISDIEIKTNSANIKRHDIKLIATTYIMAKQ